MAIGIYNLPKFAAPAPVLEQNRLIQVKKRPESQ
jgi:hypothetical protein